MNAIYKKIFLSFNFLPYWLSSSATLYDFKVDGILYKVNSDGITVTVMYTHDPLYYDDNYDVLTEAHIPSIWVIL